MNPASKHMIAHVGRKRARGECSYGGCHEKTGRARFCHKHAAQANAWNLAGKMRRRSTDDLRRLLEWHQRAVDAASSELSKRAENGPMVVAEDPQPLRPGK